MSDTLSKDELAGLFGAGWDHARDVLVVLGPAGERFARALAAVGQERTVHMRSGGAPLPSPAVAAETPLDLYRAVLGFPGDAPRGATLRRQPGTALTPADQEALTRALRAAVESHGTFRRTLDVHGRRWAEHGLANLAHAARVPAVSALRGAFAGVPCAIVSPGPSLVRNAAELRRAAGRALVMTCSHALIALRDAGVVPDLVVASDPIFSRRHYEGVDPRGPAAFALDVAVHPDHFALPMRRAFAFASHATMDEWVLGAAGDSARLDTGGSVACSELSLATLLGCDPILFVGQDLAFTDGRYYAASSVDGGARIQPAADGASFVLVRPVPHPVTGAVELVQHPAEGMVGVPGWSGGIVPTSTSLLTFLRWFEVAARSSPARLFNCTEGGAHVDGMTHAPLAEVMGELPERALDVGAVLDARTAGIDLEARRRGVRAAVLAMRQGVEQALAEAAECRRLAGLGDDPRALAELGRLEGRLARSLRGLPFLSMMGQERIRAAQAQGGGAESLAENLAAAAELFGVVEDAGRAAREPLSRVLAELTAPGSSQ